MDELGFFGVIETVLAPIKECFLYFSIIILTINFTSGFLDPFPVLVNIATWGTIVFYGLNLIIFILSPIIAKLKDDEDIFEDNIALSVISIIIFLLSLAAGIIMCFFQSQIMQVLHVDRILPLVQWIATCLLASKLLETILNVIPDIIGAFVAAEDY